MAHDAFTPIAIEIDQLGNMHSIESVRGAVDFLAGSWRGTNLESRDRALEICRLALKAKKSPEQARNAFIAAAKDAGFSVHGGTRTEVL